MIEAKTYLDSLQLAGRHLAAVSPQVERTMGVLEERRARVAALGSQLTSAQERAALLALCTLTLEQLLQTVTAESVQPIEQLVTYGLRTVFEGQDLRFRLALSQSRDRQSMEPLLTSAGVEGPILDAFGGGPGAVAAFLLRVLVIRRLKLAPVVLLDEPFPMVSEEYRPNVGKLLRELADKLGMVFVVVTHDAETLTPFAHRTYRATAAPGTPPLTELKAD